MARFDGELVEETKPRFGGEPVKEEKQATPEAPKTGMDRLKQFGESMVGGTILGAAAPELTMGAGAAIGAIPSPYTRAVGTGLQSAGRAMRGERGLAAAGGALSGGTGDIAGQFAQARGAGTLGTFAAELAGGIAGPAFINTISEAVKYSAKKLLGIDPISAVKTVAKDLNIDEAMLTPTQKQYIKDQVEKLRGGPATTKSQEKLHDVLKTGATDITAEAEKRASQAKLDAATKQKELEAQAQKMSLAGKKTETIGEKAIAEAQAARSGIGNDREVSNIGSSLRDRIVNLFGDIANKRSQAYNAQKKIRDAVVAEKESAGQLVKDMPEYKNLLDDLKRQLLIGAEAQTQKTAPVTEKGVLQAYQNIYDAVSLGVFKLVLMKKVTLFLKLSPHHLKLWTMFADAWVMLRLEKKLKVTQLLVQTLPKNITEKLVNFNLSLLEKLTMSYRLAMKWHLNFWRNTSPELVKKPRQKTDLTPQGS